mmetsp:Transcript_6921/g.15802  ORF Transcript_6921/g.15802 Transcript_6921/m.15802 type:complete len:206 (+) Transcript_6921:400-1017(+)
MKTGCSLLLEGPEGGFNGVSHAAPLGKFGLASVYSNEFNDPSSSNSVPNVICDSDRMACARLKDGGGFANEDRGENTGCPRDSDGKGDNIDAKDAVESDRRGAPSRNGGMDIMVEAFDPMESDRRGAALRRLGKEIMEKPPMPAELVESCRLAMASFSSSLAKTMCPQETLRLYLAFLDGEVAVDEVDFMIPMVLARVCLAERDD